MVISKHKRVCSLFQNVADSICKFYRRVLNVVNFGAGRKIVFALSLCVVFVSPLFVYTRGVNWALAHPDERRIAEWMAETCDSGNCPYIEKRIYPEGLFVLGRICNYFDKKCRILSSKVDDWCCQHRADDNVMVENAKDLSLYSIRDIRHLNAGLMAFSAVFVFLCAYVILENKLAAMAGALLYALHPFVVEHAHYAETDAIMLFTGTLAMWLTTLSLKRRNVWLFLASSFLGGFAVASKFSLVPFGVVMPVCAVVLGVRKSWNICRTGLFAAVALLMFASGFLAGTPKLYLAPGLFFEQMRMTKIRTYGEMRGLLGESAGRAFASLFYKIRSVLDEAYKCGWLWWVVCAGAVPLWFARKYRGIFAAFPLFGFSYLVVAVFFFPWFRNQEFLPVLPFLSVSATLPLVFAMRMKNNRSKLAAVSFAGCSLLVVACMTVVGGLRMSSAFSSIETRAAASFWTSECAPVGKKYIFESYSCSSFPFPIARNGQNEVENIKKIENYSIKRGRDFDCDYFFRTVDMKGRGNIDPVTGERYLSRQLEFDNIITNSVLLETWRILPGVRPMFSQPAVELYAYGAKSGAGVDMPPVPPSSPIVIKSRRFGYSGFRARSNNGIIGPTEAVGIVGKRTDIEFDPLPPGKKYYAVAVNLAGGTDAEVEWSRGFDPLRQHVRPGRAVLFTSNCGLSGICDAVPSSRVRMHGDDQRSLCIAVITSNPFVATRVLRRFGNESDAAKIELGNGIPEWSGKSLQNKIPASEVSFCGIPAKVIGDFARFRSGRNSFSSDLVTVDPKQVPKRDFHYLELPYVLEAKRYSLVLSFHVNKTLSRCCTQIMDGCPHPDFPECDLQGAALLSQKVLGVDGENCINVEFIIEGRQRYAPFYFGIKSGFGVYDVFKIKSAELRWN